MKLPGYCTKCHRIKTVRVTGHGLMMMQATRSTPQGLCDGCQEAQDDKRTETVRGRR